MHSIHAVVIFNLREKRCIPNFFVSQKMSDRVQLGQFTSDGATDVLYHHSEAASENNHTNICFRLDSKLIEKKEHRWFTAGINSMLPDTCIRIFLLSVMKINLFVICPVLLYYQINQN